MAEADEKAGKEKIRKEALRRIGLAEAEKIQFEGDFTECYQFAMPHRVRPRNDTKQKSQDASENFTSLGSQLTADFASEFSDTFMPEHRRWVESEASIAVAKEFGAEFKEALKEHDDTVFDAIASANFYEAVKQGAKDLSISAAGMIIRDYGANQPFHCQPIPLNELWIKRDSRGAVGSRFWIRNLTIDELQETFPHIPLPPKLEGKKRAKDATVKAVQGCWRDYSVPAEVAWIVVTMFDAELMEDDRVVGDGSAPILVMRWDPDPGFAWGIGPCINALPDYRSIDETEYLKLKGLARRVDPPFAYDDDNVINLEAGLPNGVGIPRMKGSQIDVIESKASLEDAMYSTAEMEHRIRRHYFLDEPRQEGKTPPTLGQWMDESLRRQRRLATPTAPLWPEFISEAFLRFRYLLVKRGELDPQLKVGDKNFPLRPINPLKRAALQEEAAASERFLGSIAAIYGEQAPMLLTDMAKTVATMHTQTNATGVTLKSPGEIKSIQDLMQQGMIAQLAAQVIGDAGPAAAGAAGAPPA